MLRSFSLGNRKSVVRRRDRRVGAPIEPLESRRLLAVITSGQRLVDTISVVGEIDTHTFTASAHDHIAVSLGDTGVTGFFPQVQVLAPDNSVLATVSGQTGGGIDLPNVVQSGTYTISIKDLANTTGGYAVSMFRAPAAQVVDADSFAITSGQRVTGTIDPGDLDVYTFTANAHDSLALAVGDTGSTGFFPQIQLFAPDGSLVDSNAGQTGAGLDIPNLAQSGTYYAVVRHAGDTVPGPYALTMFRSATTQAVDADSGPIVSGERKTGTIEAGDMDVYTFAANAGDYVALAVGDTGNTGFFPEIQLFAPDGAQIGIGFGQTGGGIDVPNLPLSGSYSVLVRHAGDTVSGIYALSMVRAPATQVVDSDSGSISSGQRVSGTIDLGDIDVYTFTAQAGDSLALAVGDTGNTSFFPQLQVFAPDGTLLGNSAAQTGVGIDLAGVAQSGTYYAVVRHAGDIVAGAYSLSMFRTGVAQQVDADSGPISSGQRVIGTIDLGDLDVYTFSASAHESVSLAVGDPGGTSFFPQVQVYGPTGLMVGTNAGQAGAGVDLLNLADGGTYYAVLRHAGDSTPGSYAMTMVRLPATQAVDADSGPLVSSQHRSGRIDFGDIDVYTFTANAGTAFSIAVGDSDSTGFFPQLQVYAPNGTQLFNGAGQTSTSFDALNLTQSGTYYAVVRMSGDAFTGRYLIDLAKVPGAQTTDPLDANDGGPIASGQSRSGAITLADMDVFTLPLTSGNNVTVQLNRLAGNSFNPRLDIFDPNGVRVATQTGTTTASITLSNVRATGTYYLVVRETADDSVGNYSIGVDTAPAADTRAPVVTNSRFDYDTPRQQVVFTMSESIGTSFSIGDVSLLNVDTALPVPGANLSAAFNAVTNEIVLQFTGFPGLALPDGNYRATLGSGSVLDTASIPLAGNVVLDFFALAGDANRDRVVNIGDLATLATNWQVVGKVFSEGDFNYDGTVDIGDLAILATSWQKTLAPPTILAARPAKRLADATFADDDLIRAVLG